MRSLADRDYVYVWADGVHFNLRLEDERLAAQVVAAASLDRAFLREQDATSRTGYRPLPV
jgi:hypothetical protein